MKIQEMGYDFYKDKEDNEMIEVNPLEEEKEVRWQEE